MKFTVFVLLALVFCSISEAQRSQRARGRSRSRGRNRGGASDQCHLKEVDSCLDKLESLSKGPNPTALIASSEGLDTICTAFNDVVKCAKTYIRKCGTPLQRELVDFGAEYFVSTIKRFCDAGPQRENFLKHSPCIHTNVLSSTSYKSSCNNNYLVGIDHVMNRNKSDDRLDTMCCAHNAWEDCTNNLIEKHCGSEGQKSFVKFIDKALGGLTQMLCPRAIFPPTGNICKKSLPRGKAKGKFNSDNPVTKYLTSYFAFLLATN